MNKNKDSEKMADLLANSVASLRRGEGIVLLRAGGERVCLYPIEFLRENSFSDDALSDNQTAINLAKRAGLLPLLAIIPDSAATSGWAVFSQDELEQAMTAAPELIETARANLPIDGAEDSKIVSFRALGDEAVHLALVIGMPENKDKIPLVRVHSSCVTGDLLGSLRCDCGDQLRLALDAIKSAGYGVLLYLNQEGRGIGISNKIRAYGLQEQGMDTYTANHALGFEADERDFSIAAKMLDALGISKIRLLSNNPHKAAELAKYGVNIAEVIPLVAQAHEHNQAYLKAKADKGHLL